MKRRRILVVDDEPDLAGMFKQTLERSQFDVDAFNDPFAALEHFKVDMYDLLLIDIKMPKMGGFELYKRMIAIDSKPIAGKDLIEQIKLQLEPVVREDMD